MLILTLSFENSAVDALRRSEEKINKPAIVQLHIFKSAISGNPCNNPSTGQNRTASRSRTAGWNRTTSMSRTENRIFTGRRNIVPGQSRTDSHSRTENRSFTGRRNIAPGQSRTDIHCRTTGSKIAGSYNNIILYVFLLMIPPALSAQETSTLTLLFAGDIMGHDTQIASAQQMGGGTYDYSSCFQYVKPYISSADIAIGNLEVTFAGPPYKGYPAFSSPDALADAIRDAGFDILVNANNHAIDRGKAGLERTLDVLDSLGIIQTGVFRTPAERRREYPLIIEKNNIRLALLNYTYGTNGIRVTAPNIVNYIDTAQVRKDLEKAVTARPDYTIVLMHWGLEYERTENNQQRQLAQFLLEHGADAVIGSHPHVVQPIRMYEDHLVVYSKGNMISNQRKRYTDGGILVDLTLEKTDITRMKDYSYLPIWVHKAKTSKGTAFSLVPAALDSTFYRTMRITPEDATAMKTFLEDTRGNLEGVPERKLISSPQVPLP